MAKRYVGHIPGFSDCWLLAVSKNVYILPLAHIKAVIETPEGDFLFTDFLETGQKI